MVFMPNITTNHAITYTNWLETTYGFKRKLIVYTTLKCTHVFSYLRKLVNPKQHPNKPRIQQQQQKKHLGKINVFLKTICIN